MGEKVLLSGPLSCPANIYEIVLGSGKVFLFGLISPQTNTKSLLHTKGLCHRQIDNNAIKICIIQAPPPTTTTLLGETTTIGISYNAALTEYRLA
jgi:hypothetical protein